MINSSVEHSDAVRLAFPSFISKGSSKNEKALHILVARSYSVCICSLQEETRESSGTNLIQGKIQVRHRFFYLVNWSQSLKMLKDRGLETWDRPSLSTNAFRLLMQRLNKGLCSLLISPMEWLSQPHQRLSSKEVSVFIEWIVSPRIITFYTSSLLFWTRIAMLLSPLARDSIDSRSPQKPVIPK